MNKSGIKPVGNRIVVKPDDVERRTEGGIIIPDTEADKHAMAQSIGTLVDVGADCWIHEVERSDGARKVTGYSEPWAKVGDRIAFAKYSGLQVEGEDGEVYRILNDTDVTAIVSKGVSFTGLKSRKRLGERNE